jgi:hypothetical protein
MWKQIHWRNMKAKLLVEADSILSFDRFALSVHNRSNALHCNLEI